MHGSLFVPHQHMPYAILLEERVVDRQHGAARIAENNLDTLFDEDAQKHLGAIQRWCVPFILSYRRVH
ncbi:hypothetical protein AA101099_2303 [Neoasaia chiangmaiensis NBRC 101099]|nr:hypothetical protein AA101099_2303 [Neoasaia chiangmaiensis NBRC 101099]